MRCFFIMISAIVLAGCAIDPSSTSQVITGSSGRINALSNLNKHLGDTNTFVACLNNQQRKTVDTLAKYLTADQQGSNSPSAITITSDNLSTYTSALWSYSKQNKSTMLEILALHRAHDKTCFEREILVHRNKPASARKQLGFSDYEQSHKILGNIYDYLHSTLTVTEFSELDEQFARDHIPVKVLLPTT